jgi:FKBP-type peptidyl-prolyl cis-trans isomerase SlyD
MIVSKDKVISVTYELKNNDADSPIIEKVDESRPMTFLFGAGNLLKDFEAKLESLKTGDSFDFVLTCEQAYGPVTEDAKIMLPLNAFEVEGQVDYNMVKMGNKIPMMDQAGNRLTGTVIEISSENVRMDFNHPLAGQDLHFKGRITEIREATEEEKTHGHIHASGGCGCGSGSCSSDEHDMMDEGCGCGSSGCGC